MQQNLIFALHGFLGHSSDWSAVSQELETVLKDKTSWITPDLFSASSSSILSLPEMPISFLNFYQNKFKLTGRKIFVGYSLGARLGMHFLENYTQDFDHFIFVSGHPGLQSAEEKKQRLDSDKNWSALITDIGWSEFLQKWNSQDIFNTSVKDPIRERSAFDLQKLKASLELWSLGQQSDLRSALSKNRDKITWVVGSKDAKFFKLAEDLEQKKILLDFNRIFSGHRILFENPTSLANLIAQVISKLR